MQISKKEFCRILGKVEKAWRTDLQIADLARNIGSDFLGSDMSYLACEVCDLLKIAMNNDCEDIEYFCFELEFGKKWKPGMIEDEDGNDIDLSSAEKLFDFLEGEEKGSDEN